MAIPHTAPGEVITLRAGPSVAAPDDSETLIRTDHLEVFRFAVPAGKVLDCRTAAGLMIVQCLEGSAEFRALGRTLHLTPGTMMYLPDGEPHALTALADTLLIVTLMLHRT